MQIRLNAELKEKLKKAAKENKTDVETYVNQLIESYVDHDAWFRKQVQKGLDQLDRGEFLTHEEVALRIERLIDAKRKKRAD